MRKLSEILAITREHFTQADPFTCNAACAACAAGAISPEEHVAVTARIREEIHPFSTLSGHISFLGNERSARDPDWPEIRDQWLDELAARLKEEENVV